MTSSNLRAPGAWRTVLLLVLTCTLAIASGCRDAEPEARPNVSILLATTTSVRDTRLLDALLPDFTKASGAEVRVHTGVGENTPQHLYWNRDLPVWEEAGDMVVLADQRGVMHAAKPLE